MHMPKLNRLGLQGLTFSLPWRVSFLGVPFLLFMDILRNELCPIIISDVLVKKGDTLLMAACLFNGDPKASRHLPRRSHTAA